MTISSIRALMNADDYRGTSLSRPSRCAKLIHEAEQVSSDSARVFTPTYKRVTSLWGRIKVALSGAEAKRERACARLNTFIVTDKRKFNDYDLWRNTASNIAFEKFAAVYNSSSGAHQKLMLEMLAQNAQV